MIGFLNLNITVICLKDCKGLVVHAQVSVKYTKYIAPATLPEEYASHSFLDSSFVPKKLPTHKSI